MTVHAEKRPQRQHLLPLEPPRKQTLLPMLSQAHRVRPSPEQEVCFSNNVFLPFLPSLKFLIRYPNVTLYLPPFAWIEHLLVWRYVAFGAIKFNPNLGWDYHGYFNGWINQANEPLYFICTISHLKRINWIGMWIEDQNSKHPLLAIVDVFDKRS